MAITKEFVTAVRQRLAENPRVPTSRLAMDLCAPEADVMLALPRAMRLRADNTDFDAIWESVSRWKNLAVDRGQASDTGAEAGLSGISVPDGGAGRALDPLPDARLLREQIGSIWFASMPLPGGDNCSVRFFNKAGAHIVSLYLGGDRCGAADPEAKAEYDALRERFGIVPTPPVRCKGCCGCGAHGHTRDHGHHGHADGFGAAMH